MTKINWSQIKETGTEVLESAWEHTKDVAATTAGIVLFPLTLSGCGPSAPPVTESEKKFNPNEIKNALEKKGYRADTQGSVDRAPQQKIDYFQGSTYRQSSETVSGYDHYYRFQTPGLNNGSYNVKSVFLHESQATELVESTHWTQPSRRADDSQLERSPELYQYPRGNNGNKNQEVSPDNQNWGSNKNPAEKSPDNQNWGSSNVNEGGANDNWGSTEPVTPSKPSPADKDNWGSSLWNGVESLLGVNEAYASTYDPCRPGYDFIKSTLTNPYICAEYSDYIGYGEWVPIEYSTHTETTTKSDMTIAFDVTENGQTAACELQMSRESTPLFGTSSWVYGNGGDSLDCGGATWATTKTITNEKGTKSKTLSRGRDHADGLSQLIRGVGQATQVNP